MGRPKGSKNKPKNNNLKLDGGEWLQRNQEKRDIAGMPVLSPIDIPSNKLNKEDLIEKCTEEGLCYLVELWPARHIYDEKIAAQWKFCQSELIKLKKMIYND